MKHPGQWFPVFSSIASILILLWASTLARAQYAPVVLTPESYNSDVIVEKSAPPPLVPVTTASMETGTNNTGLSWYERGYHASFQWTGLPPAGSLVQSDDTLHEYRMPLSYQQANAVLIDASVPEATVVPGTPRAAAALSFLACSAAGSITLSYEVQHADGSVQTGTVKPPSWIDGAAPAISTAGRVDVARFTFAGVPGQAALLFSLDLNLSNTTSPVARVLWRYAAGAGHAALFALSAAEVPGELFSPVGITGYNHDLVVEASAPRIGPLAATTATLEAGFENRRQSLFEAGYIASAPVAGLPAPAMTLPATGVPGLVFGMATNYAANNAITLDSSCASATVTPASPVATATLVLLTAANRGPVTNSLAVHHEDGSWETNAWTAEDYMTGSGAVFTAGGRVDVTTGIADLAAGDAPRLFAAFCSVTNAASPITEMLLSFGGPAGTSATVLAISAATTATGERPVLSIAANPDGSFTLNTTVPGVLESAETPAAAPEAWRDEGLIETTRTVVPAAEERFRFYRVKVTGDSPPAG